MLSLPRLLLRPPQHPSSTPFLFLLFKKTTNKRHTIILITHKIRNHVIDKRLIRPKEKKSQTKQMRHKKSMRLFCVGHLLQSMVPTLKCSLHIHETPLEKTP